MYDPFHNYFGLADLVTKMEPTDSRLISNTPDIINRSQDFQNNGITMDFNPVQTGFLPLALPMIKDITELSKVMAARKGRGRDRSGSGSNGLARPIVSWCVFCKNNGESEVVYASHKLKSEDGRTTCPILRAYTCPICGINGDRAHTIKYCPISKEQQEQGTLQQPLASGPGTIGTTSQYRTPRTSTGRRRATLPTTTSINGFMQQ